MIKKIARRLKIKASIRTKVSGTAERPRLTVFRSNSQIYAQVIDDSRARPLLLHRRSLSKTNSPRPRKLLR